MVKMMENKLKPITSPPSKEEVMNRIEKVRSMMKKENLDYYVCYNPINVYYLTNFAFYVHERPFLLIIPLKKEPIMLIPKLERGHFEQRAIGDFKIVDYYEFPAKIGDNWHDHFQGLIENNSNVGVEPEMPMLIFQKTPGRKKIIDIVGEARIIKTDYEIGRCVHSCKVANRGHKVLLKTCRPKVLEFVIYKEVTNAMITKIIKDIPNANFIVTQVACMILPPSVSHDPHLIPQIFQEMEKGGPHVSGVSSRVDGYGVEVERTFFLGNIPENAKKPFDVMMKARELAYNILKPGVIFSEIDIEVRKFITKNGYGKNIIHRTGHGLGITGHEPPYVAEGYERKVEPGMLISIEPGIYIPGVGGFRHSDTVLITDEGYIKLTKAPEELDELIIQI